MDRVTDRFAPICCRENLAAKFQNPIRRTVCESNSLPTRFLNELVKIHNKFSPHRNQNTWYKMLWSPNLELESQSNLVVF